MTDELARAIKALYTVFNPPLPPGEISQAMCQGYPQGRAQDAELRSAPRSPLRASCLRRFAGSALTTMGELPTFKHFLPRMLEIVAVRDGDLHASLGQIALKLDYGEWLTWPHREQAAIRRFLDAWFDAELADDPMRDYDPLDPVSTLAIAEPSIAPYLQQWDEHPAANATLRIAHVLLEQAEALQTDRPFDEDFIDPIGEPQVEFKRWIMSSATAERLARAFHATDEVEMQTLLSRAEQAHRILFGPA